MSKRSTLSAFFGTFGSAVRAASAVEGGYAPKARDLKQLGIDPAQFNKIGR